MDHNDFTVILVFTEYVSLDVLLLDSLLRVITGNCQKVEPKPGENEG